MAMHSKYEREALAKASESRMAEALLEAWRIGELKLVRQTLRDVRGLPIAEQWQRQVAARMLPGEREDFNRYIGG